MEEREHPSDRRSSSLSSHSLAGNSSESLPSVFQISDKSSIDHGTYIVQVPRDQVYRVPPPENAVYVEKRRKNNRQEKSKSSSGGSCSLSTIIGIIVFLLIVAIIGSVLGIFLSYDDPNFSVDHFLVKKLINSRVHHKQNLEYDIKVKVQNPNKYHEISYDQDGSNVALNLKQKEIAIGKFPSLDQGSKGSTEVNVKMHGSSSKLPKEVAKTMNGTHSKRRISLSLSMNVPIRLRIAGLNIKSKKIDVTCSFLVDRFDKGARVVTQECG